MSEKPKAYKTAGEWEPVFNELAKECHLNLTLQEAFATVQEFTGKLAL